MTLRAKLMALLPSLTEADFAPRGRIVLVDDGSGPFIGVWDHPTLARPTDAAIAAVVPAVPVPHTVSPFQAQAALDEIGKLAQVEALMADPATPKKTKMAWNKATEFRRTSPTVLAMAQAIGLTSAQLDDLFIRAAQIEA